MSHSEFEALFQRMNLSDPNFHQTLVQTLIQEFHQPGKISKQEKAILILDRLFAQFSLLNKKRKNSPYDFKKFIRCNLTTAKDTKAFLSTLLTGLYFGDIDLKKDNVSEDLDSFLYLILAECIGQKRLIKVISNTSFNSQIHLVYYAHKYYREGAYYFLEAMKAIYGNQKDPSYNLMIALMNGLKQKYYDLDRLQKLLQQQTYNGPAVLQGLLDQLENYALKETKEVHRLFFEVVGLMVNSPLAVFEEMKRINQGAKSWSLEEQEKEKRNSELGAQELKKGFSQHLAQNYTVEDFQHFGRLFGLEGHAPYFQFKEVEFRGRKLKDKLSALLEILRKPSALLCAKKTEINSYFSFVFSIFLHLNAYRRDASKYESGLKKIAFVVPTKGRELSNQPSLSSLMEGLSSLIEYLNSKLDHKHEIKNYPVFVFDQSDDSLLKKNRSYIAKLNRKYKSSIVSISKRQLVQLSQKLEIEPLINTTGTGHLGYGGARNAEFLLTAVFKQAFLKGKKKPEQVLSMSKEELKSIFQENVLGKESDILFMADDDIELPMMRTYANAAVAHELSDHYFFYSNYQLGRATKQGNITLPLTQFLNYPLELFQFSQWDLNPVIANVSDCLCRPRVTLNLPYGAEENDFEVANFMNYFSQPSIHLAGTRYPKGQIPTHFIVGLDKHLKSFFPYSVILYLIQDTLFPLNRAGRTVFPWNDLLLTKTFHSFREALDFAIENKFVMQEKFWKNIEFLFRLKDKHSLTLANILDLIIHENIPEIVKNTKKKGKLTVSEKKALSSIEDIYLTYQKDARLFFEFGNEVLKQVQMRFDDPLNWFVLCSNHTPELIEIIDKVKEMLEKKHSLSFSQLTITKGLHRLFHVVGAGEFIEILQNMVVFNAKARSGK